MFTDPQSITINAVPITLPRVTSPSLQSSSYSKDDGTVKLGVTQTYGKRTRRTIRIDHSKVAPDPLISAQNIKHSMACYLVVDVPVTGYTIVEAKQVIDGLTAYLTATSGARVTQLLGGEN